jgi:hypothetical protein
MPLPVSLSRKRIPACSKADDKGQLFGLLCPPAFAEANSGATAVLVDELDAGHFQGTPNR